MKVSQKQRNLAIQTRSELNYPDQRTWHKKISSKHRASYNNPKTRKGLWNQKNSTGTKANRSNFLLKLFLHPIATFFRSVSKSKASIPFLLAGQLSAAISPPARAEPGLFWPRGFQSLVLTQRGGDGGTTPVVASNVNGDHQTRYSNGVGPRDLMMPGCHKLFIVN